MERISYKGPKHENFGSEFLEEKLIFVNFDATFWCIFAERLIKRMLILQLKVHKREKFFGSDFEFFTFL